MKSSSWSSILDISALSSKFRRVRVRSSLQIKREGEGVGDRYPLGPHGPDSVYGLSEGPMETTGSRIGRQLVSWARRRVTWIKIKSKCSNSGKT
ncbi:hypothetical protein U9M48_036051 [Paspalum notatum var. saurae]|uniref:Uncharacterized protein n=1 Tax=Paspalum notatum var. saurae TaxID=547442 RepID=A0AAQ3UEG7_PASNO